MQKTDQKRSNFWIILVLGSLTALGPFSIDMYLPSFPGIAKDLSVTVSQVAYSLTSYFIGIAIGQIVYGPLLDRFGRLKPIYFGLAIYITASIGCAFASSIESLSALRFVQAIGSCAGAVAATAMVRDLFPVKDNAKIYSLLMLVVGASPMLAPTIGGFVTAALGWHSIFYILALLSCGIIAGVYFVLPESSKPDKAYSLRPMPILRNYLSVLKEPQFVTFAIIGAMAICGLLVYVSGSPVLFMEIFEVGEKTYGMIFAMLAFCFIGSNQLNSLFIKKYRNEHIIIAALIMMLSTALIFFTTVFIGKLTLPLALIFIAAYLSCTGFILPNTAALAMAPFSRNAGSASALLGAMQMGFGSIATVIVSSASSKSVLPMASVMVTCTVIPLLTVIIGRKLIAKKHKLNEPIADAVSSTPIDVI